MRRWSRTHRIVGGLGAALLLPALGVPATAGTGAATAASAAQAFRPGAPGAGDSYFPRYGNGGYNVGHYDLHIRYGHRSNRIKGRAGIRARATHDLSRFNLDLVGMNVTRIRVDGKRAGWTRSGHELVVTPKRGLREGARFTVKIRYAGRPATFDLFGSRSGWLRTTDGGAIAIGEPEVAAGWFPVNDHPRDKASYSISVNAAKRFDVVSNGRLLAKRKGDGRTVWRWHASAPMASYLATVGIGRYDGESYRTREGWRVRDAVQATLSRRVKKAAKRALGKETKVLRFLEKRFGDYPFGSLGGIVVNGGAGFALENQTRPVYSPGFFDGGADDLFVVVHELAHQWYGDDVSIDRWRDIWLNEGFATYAEWLWFAHKRYGSTQDVFDYYAGIPARNDVWDVEVADPGRGNLFGWSSYVRGAMTLHVLRKEVGKRDFFRTLRGWAKVKAGGNGSTSQFERYAEAVSGEQLDRLFAEWLHTPGKPKSIRSRATERAASARPRADGRRQVPLVVTSLQRRLEIVPRH